MKSQWRARRVMSAPSGPVRVLPPIAASHIVLLVVQCLSCQWPQYISISVSTQMRQATQWRACVRARRLHLSILSPGQGWYRSAKAQCTESRCCPHTNHVTSYMAKRFSLFTSRFGRGEAHRETDAAALSRMLDSTAAVDESAPGPEVAAALGGACARALCVRAVSRVVCVLNGGVGAACSRSRVGDSARHVHRVW